MVAIDGPIYLAVSKSRRLARCMLAAHGAAFVMIGLSGPLNVVQAGLLVLVVLNAARVERSVSLSRDDDIVALLLSSTERWQVSLRDGRILAAELAAAAVVSVPLTALSLRLADGQVRHIALLADNVPHDACRRLRVRLRFARAAVD